jgi:hypothetical protein
MKLTETDMAHLRAIGVSGAVTPNELKREFPQFDSAKVVMERLCGLGLLDREIVPRRESIYQLSERGRNRVKRGVTPMGKIAEPRTYMSDEPYVPKAIVVRPGADDHLRCLSRRGNELVEHRGPLPLGGMA